MIRLKALVAAVVLLALAGGIAIISGDRNRLSATQPKGAPFPAFSLPRFTEGRPKFTTTDLGHEAVVVNFFSSWCGPCRAEHPLLMKLKDAAPIIGINYMDDPGEARKFLAKLGNPYRDIAVDKKGDFEIMLGVDSVPRTLVVVDGYIVYAHRGILYQEEIDRRLLPVLKQHQKRAGFHLF